MLRVAAVLGIGLVTGGSQYRCSASSADGGGMIDIPNTGDGPTFTTTLVLRDSAGTETYDFARDETIRFELTVRNRTDQTVQLEFPANVDDYVVFLDGSSRVRWQASQGTAIPAVVTVLTFQPHETRTFRRDWNQVLDSGSLLGRGDYEARGVLTFDEFRTDRFAAHELGSTLRAFTVR